MTSLRFHVRTTATPDEVWAVVTDVDLIPAWFPGVVAATFDGTHRHLTLGDGGTLRARVITSDPELHRFQYQFVDGFPVPVEFHLGTLDLIEDGTGTLVVYSQEVEPAGLAQIVARAVAGGTQGIADYFRDRPPPPPPPPTSGRRAGSPGRSPTGCR